jgi:hypothetical protein
MTCSRIAPSRCNADTTSIFSWRHRGNPREESQHTWCPGADWTVTCRPPCCVVRSEAVTHVTPCSSQGTCFLAFSLALQSSLYSVCPFCLRFNFVIWILTLPSSCPLYLFSFYMQPIHFFFFIFLHHFVYRCYFYFCLFDFDFCRFYLYFLSILFSFVVDFIFICCRFYFFYLSILFLFFVYFISIFFPILFLLVFIPFHSSHSSSRYIWPRNMTLLVWPQSDPGTSWAVSDTSDLELTASI